MSSSDAARVVLADTTSAVLNTNLSDAFSLSSSATSTSSSSLPPLPPSSLFASPGKTRRAQWDKSRLSMTRPVFVDQSNNNNNDDEEDENEPATGRDKKGHFRNSHTLSSLASVLSSPTKRHITPPDSFPITTQPSSIPLPATAIPETTPNPPPSSIPIPSAASRSRRATSALNSTYSHGSRSRSSSPAPLPAASPLPPTVPRVFKSRDSIAVAATSLTSSSSSASNAAALLGQAAELVRNSKRAASKKKEEGLQMHKRRKSSEEMKEEASPPVKRAGRPSLSSIPPTRTSRQSLSMSMTASAFVRASSAKSGKAAAMPVIAPAPSAVIANEELIKSQQALVLSQAIVERLQSRLSSSEAELVQVNAQQAVLRSSLQQQTAAVEQLRSVLFDERRRVKEVEDLIEEKEQELQRLTARLSSMEEELKEGEAVRRKLHAYVEEVKGSIRVMVRVRPALAGELAGDVFGYSADPSVPLIEVRGKEERSVDGSSITRKRQAFVFDHVLGPATSQEAVFDTVQPLLTSVLDGYNVCVMAYGQTGSGKTFTMEGRAREGEAARLGHTRSPTFTSLGDAHHDERGLVQRSVEELFRQMEQRKAKRQWQYSCSIAVFEVYPKGGEEMIRDLLVLHDDATHELKQTVRPASALPNIGGTGQRVDVTISNLSYHDAQGVGDVLPLLERAREGRKVGATESNERSSRSHLLVRLMVAGAGPEGERSEGTLHLIDLAGSERVKVSKAEGVRLKETVGINRSLSALADVVAALSKESSHIPFRNSKLTHLLQPYLGGDSKVQMMVCLSGEEESVGESLCSLRFAQTVSGCGGRRKA